MEVSSHALALNRVAGIEYDTAVLTNITQDHLDFHKTMENYRDAKGLFSSICMKARKPNKTAVFNSDDPSSAILEKSTRTKIMTYGKG
jgi:UDP-N-acetylmuramyl tripeptide synthase